MYILQYTFLFLIVSYYTNSVSCFSFKSSRIVSLYSKNKKSNLSMRWGLKGPANVNIQQGNLEEGQTLRDTVPFELRGFSLPAVVFTIGILLTSSSFIGFFSTDGGGDGAVSSLGFVYGIPVFLIGLSLWYAEIPPVIIETSEAGDRAWENKATETLRKVKLDVTRHRYGDDAHLDSTLETLGLKLQGKKFPKMIRIEQEESSDKELIFTMVFQSLDTPYKIWAEPERVERYAKYFGPNVNAEVLKIDSEQRLVGIRLTTTSNDSTSSSSSTSNVPLPLANDINIDTSSTTF